MPQKQSPFLEGKYGWNFGESGWNTGMDENLIKFSFLFSQGVDSVVSALPESPIQGTSCFLTTDNRFYYYVDSLWQSSPCPKWFSFRVKSTGVTHLFDGTTLLTLTPPETIESELNNIQTTVDSLGSAAFKDSSEFATPGDVDVASAQSASYTDSSIQSFKDVLIDPLSGVNVAKVTVPVEDITALQSLPRDKKIAANVIGYYAGSNIGGGVFYWDGSSVAPHNGGTVIEVTGVVTGRWVRQGVGSKIYADWFGIRPSPVNDTALTQAAMNACSLQHPGCNFVFRNGTYVFGPAVDNRAIISLPAGVYPETENATITVEDGLVTSTTRFEGVFCQLDYSYDLGDFRSARLDFDLNGQNNLIPSGAASGTKGAGLVIRRAKSATIGTYRARNVSGRQCLMVGDSADQIGLVDIGLLDVENVGAGIAANTGQTDHSAIYCVSDSLHIGHAEGHNEILSGNTTALIESHAKATVVDSFNHSNFQIAHIVSAAEQSIDSYHAVAGHGKGDILLAPWTLAGKTIGTVTIGDGVSFERIGGIYPLVDMNSKNNERIEAINIGRIVVRDTNATPSGAAAAFVLGRVTITRIDAADIDGATGRLMQTGTILDGVSELYVSELRAKNLNKVNNASYPQAVRLFGTLAFKAVEIEGIKLGETTGQQTIGILIECPVTRLRLYDNEMAANYTTPYSTVGATTSDCYLRHKGTVAPSASGVRANAGSQWLVIGGAQYVTTADGTTWTTKAY